jgi:succinoglycan biosynthesis transport protein ExoP
LKMFTIPEWKKDDFDGGHPVALNNMQGIDPHYHELFKGLRAKIEYKIDMVELRVLALTSAVAEEGKTLTAVNLAANMASTGRKKVLLVDMDLRKASIARMLGIEKGPGLSEYLYGKVPREEILRKSSVPGLFIIPGGRTISSPADILAGERFRSFLRDLREQFDLVILDTPPVLPVPDALTISEQVDAFIMIFRLSHTPHQLFRQAIEELGDRKIMGVVLNGEEQKSSKYYSRYYGKYYQKVHPAENIR